MIKSYTHVIIYNSYIVSIMYVFCMQYHFLDNSIDVVKDDLIVTFIDAITSIVTLYFKVKETL